MNFVVTRTKFYEMEGPPCEGAYSAVLTVTEVRSAEDDNRLEYFRRVGRNHRPRGDGLWLREVDAEVWLIDLEWSDLEAFIARYGSIVIEPWERDEKRLLLEIYDGWRE